jgi:uncharacterized phiE125 gp8 family phage protein
MGLQVVTPATGLVVDSDTLKLQSHIDGTAEDALLDAYLYAAQKYASDIANKQLLPATYRVEIPAPIYLDCRLRDIYQFADDVASFVELPNPPFTSLTYVKYYDVNNSLQTLSSSYYRVVTDAERPAYVVFLSGLPTMYPREDALQITFVCGYANAAAVPETIKQAIRLLAADWFKNREATVSGTIITSHPLAVDRLLTLSRS